MNRITWHHTGGGYSPNNTDKAAYHFLISGDGDAYPGDHPVLANAPGKRLAAGQYSAHTRGLNSGNIGVSVCAMVGGKWADPRASRAFPKPVQIDALILLTAKLCLEYGIAPSREHTLSHAEVQPTLKIKQSNKWDFDYQIRNVASRDPLAIGDELRQELAVKLGGTVVQAPPQDRPTLRQGATGEDVTAMQKALGLKADGAFGPKTRSAVVALQSSRSLLPDGIVGRMTWRALGL
jgi:N-acetyl-anhydromuramyl-L-alanine amidase AmpD